MKHKIIILFSLLLLTVVTVYAQQTVGTIKGTVLTNDGKPATSVTIHLKGTKRSVQAGEDGTFTLHNIAAGDYIVEVSLVGYQTVQQNVIVETNKTIMVSLTLRISNRQLQDVIVTSTKRNKFYVDSSNDVSKLPLKNLENPQVYVVVPKELLEEQQVTNFSDAIKFDVPAVSSLGYGGGIGGDWGVANFASRGFASTQPLRNGISAAGTSDIDPANIEKIEVLKGPAGTLFGSPLVSWGGLINYVTKQPYNQFGGEISYTGGSYDLNRFTADINTPLSKDSTLLFRLNAAHTYQQSSMDFGFTNTTFFAPTILYKPNDRLSILLEVDIYQRQGTTSPIFYIFDSMQVHSPADLNIQYKRSFTNNDITFNAPTTEFFGQVNYKLSNHWTSQTAVSVANGIGNGDYQWESFSSGSGDSLVRTITDWRGDITTNTEIQQNFISDYTWGKVRNRLVAGLDFINSVNTSEYYYVPFDTVNASNPGAEYLNLTPAAINQQEAAGQDGPYASNYNQSDYAVYASDVFKLSGNLIVNAGLRVDDFNDKGTFDPIASTYSGAYQQTALSPKFGVVYQPVKDRIALFANYSNGFTNNTGVDFYGAPFKPSNGNQFEAGVKLDIWKQKLSATFSYYNIYASNLLETDPNHPGFDIQDGEERSKGFEASIIATPFSGFNLIAGYGYNDSKYLRYINLRDYVLTGLRDPGAGSPNTANLYASYHLQHGNAKGLGFGFGALYVSADPDVDGYGGVFVLPAYIVLNASVFYDQPHYRFGIRVNNLTNQEYYVGWYTLEPQALRSLSANVILKFK